MTAVCPSAITGRPRCIPGNIAKSTLNQTHCPYSVMPGRKNIFGKTAFRRFKYFSFPNSLSFNSLCVLPEPPKPARQKMLSVESTNLSHNGIRGDQRLSNIHTQLPDATVSFLRIAVRLRPYSLWEEVPHRKEKLLPRKRPLLTIQSPAFTIIQGESHSSFRRLR